MTDEAACDLFHHTCSILSKRLWSQHTLPIRHNHDTNKGVESLQTCRPLTPSIDFGLTLPCYAFARSLEVNCASNHHFTRRFRGVNLTCTQTITVRQPVESSWTVLGCRPNHQPLVRRPERNPSGRRRHLRRRCKHRRLRRLVIGTVPRWTEFPSSCP